MLVVRPPQGTVCKVRSRSWLAGAEIGVALMGTWLRVREQVHSNFIGLHVENGRPDVTLVLDSLGNVFASYGASFASQRALRTLATLVQREANVLAYIDGFELCFSLSITGLFLISFFTRYRLIAHGAGFIHLHGVF